MRVLACDQAMPAPSEAPDSAVGSEPDALAHKKPQHQQQQQRVAVPIDAFPPEAEAPASPTHAQATMQAHAHVALGTGGRPSLLVCVPGLCGKAYLRLLLICPTVVFSTCSCWSDYPITVAVHCLSNVSSVDLVADHVHASAFVIQHISSSPGSVQVRHGDCGN